VRRIFYFFNQFSVLQLFTFLSFFSTGACTRLHTHTHTHTHTRYLDGSMNSDDAADDANGVITTCSTQSVHNISHLKRRHVLMAILLLYNHQIIVQLLMISGLG
jgi:hypothetical protein